MKKSIVFTLILLQFCHSVYTSPIARRLDTPPELSDTLAVAKSPFEPVTLASWSPGARNDELHLDSTSSQGEQKLITQATPSLEDDKDRIGPSKTEDSNYATKTVESFTSPESSVSTETETQAPAATTEPIEPQTEPTTATDSQSSTTVQSTEPTTTVALQSESTTESVEKIAPDNTESPNTESTPANPPTTLVTTTSTEEVTTELETKVETDPEPEKDLKQTEPVTSEASIGSNHSEITDSPIVPSSTEGTTESPISVSSTEVPVSEPTTTTTESVSTTQSSTTESATTESTTTNTESDKVEDRPSCSHLPTYNPEELQKVFKEETTFKNGTIKGKFTYINFDQRYRLVHYTRLPYGPVKIDLVEELGRSDSSDNQTSVTSKPEEIPNAVLQLRNILPNSLFGFPFLGPSGFMRAVGDNRANDGSNYFYSTDSLPQTNPTSISSHVAPAVPQVQANLAPVNSIRTADSQGQSFIENLRVANFSPQLENIPEKQHVESTNYGPALGYDQNLFSLRMNRGSDSLDKQNTLVYDYLPTPQNQYPLMPVIPLQQANYPLTSANYEPNAYARRLNVNQPPEGFFAHQSHQPHAHEHYGAQFMFSQPTQADQVNSARLKIRVKSSKSLNVNGAGGVKSAQLRAQPAGQENYSAPQSQQQMKSQDRQHRHGKQSHELRSNVNTSPVVYHVFRSPTGRTFSMPALNQNYAIAYDHDS